MRVKLYTKMTAFGTNIQIPNLDFAIRCLGNLDISEEEMARLPRPGNTAESIRILEGASKLLFKYATTPDLEAFLTAIRAAVQLASLEGVEVSTWTSVLVEKA